MNKLLISGIFVLLLIASVSGEVLINNQPKSIYNLGDELTLPVKITSLEDKEEWFTINLICNGNEINVYKELLSLSAGEEEKRNPLIPLTIKGTCKIKSSFGEEIKLSDEFKISDLITIKINLNRTIFNPGEKLIFETESKKEGGETVNGFISLEGLYENISETVKEGYGLIEFLLPKDIKAGEYSLRIKVYEKNKKGEITNNGLANYKININQIPTNLEIVFEEKEVEPGTNVKIKTILHDQSGESIKSKAIISIKKDEEILIQKEESTEEFLEYPIEYNELPRKWTVVAVSNKLKSSSEFIIKEKESVDANIINTTLIVKNTGNVPYNDSIKVSIGGDLLNLDLFLKVDEIKRYKLTAPDGEYTIEIITEDKKFKESVILTGETISIKEAKGVVGRIGSPLIWIFIIIILGLIAFIIFKKRYKKSFFGYIHKKQENKEEKEQKKDSIISPKNKSELSLSIKGEKQNISLACIKIKNLKDIIKNKVLKEDSEEENVKETLQKITDFAEDKKAVTYFNNDCLFFLEIPTKTKTFSNEKAVIEISQKAEEILKEHNRLYRKKIEFGISLNYGTVITKQEKEVLKFMSMGTLITTAKKIADISNKEILLSEKIKEKLSSNIKVEKHQREKVIVYKIKEIKDREEHKNFIKNFLERIEKN
jgi:hypothetical protein